VTATPALQRRLGPADATVIGLGSMVGAGVFAAFTPAARAAGSGLLIGLVIAAVVAFCNATSSAQLAAVYPRSGGTYVYGRERLGPWWGFIAGWSFVIGKIASSAAMALTFAAYALPGPAERPVAAAAVVALVTVNVLGVTRTALLTRVIVVVVLACLAAGVVAAWGGAQPHGIGDQLLSHGAYGILQSGGLLFFAFAGYARIATLGEEVIDPARTIPRAIVVALALAVVIYGVVAVTILTALGPDGVASNADPLAVAAARSGWAWIGPVVRIGASAASLGALLGLIAGIGRTSLAMAREGDLPRVFARVGRRFGSPWLAELFVGVVVLALVLTLDLRNAIGFSSFGVLVYYFVANLAALTQPATDRRYPRGLQVLGLVGCAALALTLPWQAAVAGAAVVMVGVALRAVTRAARTPARPGASPDGDPSRPDRPRR
jgi:APA family basic amino acid/polyamine antiporter